MFHVVGNFAKSLEVTQNYTTEYGTDKSLSVFLVTISVPCIIFKLFDIKYYHDLKIYVKGHSRSLEMAPFKRSHRRSYWHSTITMAQSCIISQIKQDIGRKS